MNIFKQTNHNLDELVFENRNKAYGAYELRSNYNKNLKRSFMITFFVPIVIILFSVIYNKLHGNVLIENPIVRDNKQDTLIITVVELPKKKFVEELQEIMAKPQKVLGDNSNYLVKKNGDVTTAISDTFVEHIILEGTEEPNGNKTIAPGTESGGKSGNKTGTSLGTEELYDFSGVEKLPEFNGDLYDYLGNETKYPAVALENGIHGTVLLSFVINTEGQVSDIQILNKVGFGCDEEAIRVIKNMPKWNAGMQNNHKVNVRMVIPLVFEINN